MTAAAACCLMAAAPAAARPSFGLNDVPADHKSLSERAFQLHREVGSKVQRVPLPWRSVEPRPGDRDWRHHDRVYEAAARRGIRTIAIVSSAPDWAAPQGFVGTCFLRVNAPACQRPPDRPHIAAFAAYAAEVAQRYPHLAAIEVYNEPNLGTYNWQPEAQPEYYAEVLRATFAAVKRVRPSLPVISGGLTPTPLPVPAGSIDPFTFLSRMYAGGARGAMDAIGVHPYPGSRSPENTDAGSYQSFMNRVRAIRNANGDAGRPLWVTEIGYTTTGQIALSEDRQAAWLPRLVTRAIREPDVRGVILHALAETKGSRDSNSTGFGITTPQLAKKPVFDRLAEAIRALEPAKKKASKRCTGKRKRTRACRCKRSRAARRKCAAIKTCKRLRKVRRPTASQRRRKAKACRAARKKLPAQKQRRAKKSQAE